MSSEKVMEMRMKIFEFICEYEEEHGFSPSLREISAAHYISVSTLLRHLDALEYEGWIQREPYRARAIRILRRDQVINHSE